MDSAANLMLITGALLIAGVLSSRLSARSGVPLIVLFVAVGLLAGEEGPLGIPLNNAPMASAISVGMLALILFDGGLGTPVRQIRRVAGPAILLGTVGVVISTVITGAAAVLLLGLSWTEGLLLGSILGSTDAAAVFATFRGRGATLPNRLRATLEVESGLNDPIAIFLVVTLTGMLTGLPAPVWWTIGTDFMFEMAVGLAIGGAVGWLSSITMRRLHLDIAGLYLVFSLATALLAFGAAQVAGGSGVIAVYAAGVIIGHARLPFERGIRRFHDGIAWIAQVGVFVLLGLLAFPSRLVAAAPGGVAIALVLVLLARPISVWIATLGFRYDWRDRIVIACGGLRGAVPVILATIPIAAHVPGAGTIFDVTFFAVLVSVVIQSTLMAPLAKKLKRLEPESTDASVSLELTALRETGQELLGYRAEAGSLSINQPISQLPLPRDALVVLVVRGAEVIAPRGSTVVKPGDQVYVLSSVNYHQVVAEIFIQRSDAEEKLGGMHEFSLDARLATVGDLQEFYGVELSGTPEESLMDYLDRTMEHPAAPGAHIPLGRNSGVNLVILSVQNGKPRQVAVEIQDEVSRKEIPEEHA
ncbi:MAG: potassium/proton antiporter [Gemmatimonadota bacterium]